MQRICVFLSILYIESNLDEVIILKKQHLQKVNFSFLMVLF